MKKTINEQTFIQSFTDYNRENQFSVYARKKLFEYLTELERDTDLEIELDVIAICCDYNMMDIEDIAKEYRIDLSHLDAEDDDYEEQCEEIVLDYLNDHTMVLGQCVDGVVFACF